MKLFAKKFFVIALVFELASDVVYAKEIEKITQCIQQNTNKDIIFPKQLMGVNLLFFAENDQVRATPGYKQLMSKHNLGALRFPGGTVADNYHWATGRTDNPGKYPIQHISSENDFSFDEFMALSKELGAEPTVVLNYLSWIEKDRVQDAFKEAADWVKYANKQKNYAVRYWEFGNEVYFFKPGKHINVPARSYARDYKAMRNVLHAIDPNVQLGAAMPQKLDMVTKFDRGRWWDNFLDEVGNNLDYIVIHDYPALTPSEFTEEGSGIANILLQVQQIVKAKLGREVPIHVTEWNIAQWDKEGRRGFLERDSMLHGLFIADALLDMAVSKVRLATFWPWRTQDRFGLVSFDVQRNLVGGEVFEVLAPYQNYRFVFDCHDQNLRMSRLVTTENKEEVLIIINRGKSRSLDLRSLLENNIKIMSVTTLSDDNGRYTKKVAAENEITNVPDKLWFIPARSLMVIRLH